MMLPWLVISAFVVCHPLTSASQVMVSVLKEVRPCFDGDVEPCLVNHAVNALLDATDLSRQMNQTQADGRSFTSSIEDQLMEKLSRLMGFTGLTPEMIESGRQNPVRTFNKAWKYIVPLLMGVILKLAAFVPLMIAVLTVIAKSALLSGNLALLFTGLNIFLKYWYPKWQESHRVMYDQQNTGEYSNNEEFAQHFAHEAAYGQQENQHENKYNRRYMMFG